MNLSTLIALLVGTVLPLVTATITKDTLNPKLKALVLILLASITGVLTSVLGALPTSLSGWEHVLLNILAAFIAAAAADFKAWDPFGTTAAVHKATSRFGLPFRTTAPPEPGAIPPSS